LGKEKRKDVILRGALKRGCVGSGVCLGTGVNVWKNDKRGWVGGEGVETDRCRERRVDERRMWGLILVDDRGEKKKKMKVQCWPKGNR